ncbi:MarR family transcriptional regulator [Microbacterium sp. 13-71-7]|uniref:MarR family winged helix-turn-helix transcriptional regulator n=1 Tax=Microbacterium sp. 13-71-7 TaxID=1970399 RepID=UPI000BD0593F|nr:MarR family transcriptional regulator [Microbacterium sp. 13-71-7]OZB83566.1 MAG: MarR family transcriptional regulator [Microbacterium sp. 13-71-7]
MADIDDQVTRIQQAWRRERPDLDVTAIGTIGRLHRLALALTEELVVVYRAHGLSEGDFDVMAALRRAGEPYEASPSDLAASTMITSGGMSKRIDRLEGAGLVTRRVGSGDARGRVIALTAEGKALIDAAFADHVANEQRLLAMVPASERAALEATLAGWLAHFEPRD